MGVINHLMGFPRLYAFVQNSIARSLHHQVKSSLCRDLPDKTGVDILDIGCGIGDYSVLFKQATYTGLDKDECYIHSATSKYGRPGVTFIAGDATKLSFSSGHFSYCFSVGLYHHLPDDAVVASLQEALRVAGPGRVIVMDAIFPPRGNFPGYLLRRLDRGKFVRTFTAYEQLLRNHFNVQEITAKRGGLLDYIYYRL
ncbi:MAG: class I SAM-dependent methyltransferase [Geobacter sp.]|nr:class I SAM-dependent methyltransferase [Geobacter sp.]